MSAATTNPNVCYADTTADTKATAKVGGIVTFTVDTATWVDITGPGSFSSAGTDSGTTYNSAGQAVLAADGDVISVQATGIGSIKVNFRQTSGTTAPSYAATITVVASCSNGVASQAYSFARTVIADNADGGYTYEQAGTNDVINSNVDDLTASYAYVTGAGDTAYETSLGATPYTQVTNAAPVGKTIYLSALLRDAYGAELPSTGVVQVTATGAVTIGASFEASTGTQISAVPSVGAAKTVITTGSGYGMSIAVAQDATAVPTASTITVSYDGTVVLTKTVVFVGSPSKVTLIDSTVGVAPGSGYLQFKVTDSAGNGVGATVENDATYNAAAVAISAGITANATASAATGKTPATDTASFTGVSPFNCIKSGKATIRAKVAVDTAATTYIYSDPITINCGGDLDTWTVSLDKASYAPGEIATLTVSGKDEDGNAVNSVFDMSGVEYSFGGMVAVTAPTNGDSFTSAVGTKTYKFSVGTSEGAFVGIFKTTGATDTTSKTLQYKVAAASGAVSMADVLKAIVSLIASINKQIAALQKALLKK
jgi:hypothetical protein